MEKQGFMTNADLENYYHKIVNKEGLRIISCGVPQSRTLALQPSI